MHVTRSPEGAERVCVAPRFARLEVMRVHEYEQRPRLALLVFVIRMTSLWPAT